jgi:glycolate oxidase FAD binding subunit
MSHPAQDRDEPSADSALVALRQQVQQASAQRTPLRLRGGGSKDFYGGVLRGEVLELGAYRGIVSYEPAELVITARCGTPLAELEAALLACGQHLPFEPPHFGPTATIGGCVAAGLSGPRRLAAGPLRDFVLGVKLLDGRGEVLRFGGQVIKNVAGFDVARLLAGSLGTLGILLEISLKVLPRPPAECTLRLELDEPSALRAVNAFCGEPLPLSASCWSAGVLHLRLSGAAAAVRSGAARLGGERVEQAAAQAFWQALREQRAPLFESGAPLWRLAVPSDTPPLPLPGEQLIEWGGGLRWWRTDADAAQVRAAAQGGHATLFRRGDRSAGVYSPLPAPILSIHRRLKAAFDPCGIFNPGRMYPEL